MCSFLSGVSLRVIQKPKRPNRIPSDTGTSSPTVPKGLYIRGEKTSLSWLMYPNTQKVGVNINSHWYTDTRLYTPVFLQFKILQRNFLPPYKKREEGKMTDFAPSLPKSSLLVKPVTTNSVVTSTTSLLYPPTQDLPILRGMIGIW